MWDFSDPVVFFAVFTVAFGVSMLVFLYFWIRRKMKIDPGPGKVGQTSTHARSRA